MDRKEDSNSKQYVSLGILSVLEKLIAFVFQATIAAYFGASYMSDSYYGATQVYDFINLTLLGAFVITLIISYNKIQNESGDEESVAFLSETNLILSVSMLVVSFVAFIMADKIAAAVAPGMATTERVVMVKCIRILAALPLINATSVVCQAFLRKHRHYVAVNTESLFRSVFGLLVIWTVSRYKSADAISLAWGYLIGSIVYTMYMFLKSRKIGALTYKVPASIPRFKQLLVMTVPMIISNGMVRGARIIDQVVASSLGEGYISCLSYANSIFNIAYVVLITNLCIILMTDFSDLFAAGQFRTIKEKITGAIDTIGLLVLPVSVLMVIYSEEIVSIIFERGRFNQAVTEKVGGVLLFYAIGLIPALIWNVYSQVLYAFGKMKASMIINVGINVVNMILDYILCQFFGVSGIAIATSISWAIAAICYHISVNRDLNEHILKNPLNKDRVKAFAAIIFSTTIMVLTKRYIPSKDFTIVLSIIVFLVIYLAFLIVLRNSIVYSYIRKYILLKRPACMDSDISDSKQGHTEELNSKDPSNIEDREPLVSVIMAAYNAEQYIEESIDSILGQTYKNIEIIICDDASTDRTLEIISKYQNNPAITILHNNTNLHQAASRNRCLSSSKGEYIAIQDADDISEPTRIEYELAAMDSQTAFIGCGCYMFNDGGRCGEIVHKGHPGKISLLWNIPHVHASLVFDKKALDTVGGYWVHDHTKRGEDYDLIMRLYAAGYRGKNIPDVLYGYRVDIDTYKRRTFRARLDECSIRYHGFKANHILFPFGWIFVGKPIVVHLIQILRGRGSRI